MIVFTIYRTIYITFDTFLIDVIQFYYFTIIYDIL